MDIKQIAEHINEEAISLRRELHKLAELSFAEYKTAAFITAYLEKLGIPCRTEVAKTGVVGYLDAGKNHTLLLRADMDALPVLESADCAFRSETDGVMHACGHDAHMAIALATAKCMVAHKERLKTNVLFVFQPGEETEGGAKDMIDTGILEEFHVACAIGLHVMNDVEVGTIRIKNGELMAAPDDFELTIKGRGGHGAYPAECADPILVAAELVGAFKEMEPKAATSNTSCVISTCVVQGGNVCNVIPDSAYLSGTVRTFDETLRHRIPEEMERTIQKACEKQGTTYDFTFHYRYPPLINHEGMADALADAVIKELGSQAVVRGGAVSMGGDDFSYFAKEVPGVYFYLGSGNEKSGISMPLHSSDFQIDESCLPLGVAAYLSFAFNDCIYFG